MTKLTRPFRIYRRRYGCWVLHCRWCGSHEECSSHDDAVEMMSVHADWFHRNLAIDNGVVSVIPHGWRAGW